MQVVLAVIDDLFQFAKASLFGVFLLSPSTRIVPPALSEVVAKSATSSEQLRLLPSHSPAQVDMSLVQGQQYFVGSTHTFLYTDPVISFDTAYVQLPYASKVYLIKFGGRWAQVQYGSQIGWVLKDFLKDQMADVLPTFAQDEVYTDTHPETVKLRAYIDDQFGCIDAGIYLTGAEYVVYALQKRKRYIPWTEERPRIPGTWQRKLKGVQGVHIAIAPKTEAVMEYIIDDIGFLVFVEAVFPDDSIKVSGIGMREEGKYAEEMMLKDQWKELRPVFISVA